MSSDYLKLFFAYSNGFLKLVLFVGMYWWKGKVGIGALWSDSMHYYSSIGRWRILIYFKICYHFDVSCATLDKCIFEIKHRDSGSGEKIMRYHFICSIYEYNIIMIFWIYFHSFFELCRLALTEKYDLMWRYLNYFLGIFAKAKITMEFFEKGF